MWTKEQAKAYYATYYQKNKQKRQAQNKAYLDKLMSKQLTINNKEYHE